MSAWGKVKGGFKALAKGIDKCVDYILAGIGGSGLAAVAVGVCFVIAGAIKIGVTLGAGTPGGVALMLIGAKVAIAGGGVALIAGTLYAAKEGISSLITGSKNGYERQLADERKYLRHQRELNKLQRQYGPYTPHYGNMRHQSGPHYGGSQGGNPYAAHIPRPPTHPYVYRPAPSPYPPSYQAQYSPTSSPPQYPPPPGPPPFQSQGSFIEPPPTNRLPLSAVPPGHLNSDVPYKVQGIEGSVVRLRPDTPGYRGPLYTATLGVNCPHGVTQNSSVNIRSDSAGTAYVAMAQQQQVVQHGRSRSYSR